MIMNNDQRESAVFAAIKNNDWDFAIDQASKVPPSRDIWQRMPSAAPEGMPEHAARKVLTLLTHKFGHHAANLPSFLFEYGQHLPTDASSEWLNALGRIAR